MKNLALCISVILLLVSTAFGQDPDARISIEITKDVNGEKRTFKGEYDNMEEMRADPNYQEFSGEDGDVNFWFGPGEDFSLHLDQFMDAGNSFFHFFDDDDDQNNSFFYHFDGDSTVGAFDFDFDGDMQDYVDRMRKLGEEMRENMKRFPHDDGDDHVSVMVWKKVKVTDVDDEFGKKGRVEESNKLELKDLTFYPNPSSNGRFKVRFTTPVEGELSLRVFNLEGKEVFSRYFERYSGTYSENIDLSGQKEGIYLLEIMQNKKRLTKKIVIN